jgi:hypothetical protein
LARPIESSLSSLGLSLSDGALLLGHGPHEFLAYTRPLKQDGLHEHRQDESQESDADHQGSQSESGQSHDQISKILVSIMVEHL